MSRKVVILSSYSPSLVTFRGPLIRQLVDAGYAVIGCGPEEEPRAEFAALGAEFRRIGPMRTSVNPFHDLGYLLRLLALFLRERPAAVIAYTAKPVIWGILAAFLSGVPVRVAMITGLGFAFSSGAEPSAWRQRVIRRLYGLTLRRATSVIFQNPDDRAEFERLGLFPEVRGRIVNGSGVETDRFTIAPLSGTPTFLLIARLLVDKGIREYAEAAERVRKLYPAARCLLVGWFDDGNPQTLSKAEVEKWVERGSIEFLGRSDDVRNVIAMVDVFVLPSYREGTPRTVLEAMAMGRAVVTTDVPGCRETVIEGVNGLLVPPRDSCALAVAMVRFIEDPSLAVRMGAEGRRIAVEKFDAVSVARAVREIAGL